MSRVCQVTGKKPMKGHRLPRQQQDQAHCSCRTCTTAASGSRAENRWVRLRVSTAGLRRIDKKGIEVVLAEIKAKSKRRKSEETAMREKIKLESSAGTGHFYTTTKNKRTTPDKMEMKKYDPKARKHVIYKETKLK